MGGEAASGGQSAGEREMSRMFKQSVGERAFTDRARAASRSPVPGSKGGAVPGGLARGAGGLAKATATAAREQAPAPEQPTPTALSPESPPENLSGRQKLRRRGTLLTDIFGLAEIAKKTVLGS